MSTADNKKLVVACYEQAFNDGQPEQAAAAHLGATYTGDRGMAVADLWRIADGRIVEHWDVVQGVPEESANDNTMFQARDKAAARRARHASRRPAMSQPVPRRLRGLGSRRSRVRSTW